MKRRTFKIDFHKDSAHWVSVVLHSSRAVMRRALNTRAGYDASNTNACCWQAGKVGSDSCIAEIHFGRDFLTLDTIVHESTHAAYHRAFVMGVKKDADNFQEWVASDAGIVAERIVALFDQARIPIRYECVKRRLL